MSRLTAKQSQHARQIARSERAEEGWLGNPDLLGAWPTREHAALGSIRAVPSGIMVLGDSVPDNEVSGRPLASAGHLEGDPFGNANENANANRAVSKDHVRTRALRGYHFPDNEVGSRPLASAGHLEGDPFGNANENANANRAVSKDHVRTRALRGYHFPDNEVGGRVLVGLEGNDNPGNDAFRAVGRGHLKDDAASARVIGANAVGETALADGLTGSVDESGPAQGAKGVRRIGSSLGGQARASSASDHSHGSGNTQDFDYLPDYERRRALTQRVLTRRGAARVPAAKPVERAEFRTLQSLVLTLCHILMDAPDLDGFERERLRKAGELPFEKAMFEWRRSEEAEKMGEYIHHPKLKHYREPHPDLVA